MPPPHLEAKGVLSAQLEDSYMHRQICRPRQCRVDIMLCASPVPVPTASSGMMHTRQVTKTVPAALRNKQLLVYNFIGSILIHKFKTSCGPSPTAWLSSLAA
jgi:hypothetical protein